MHENRQHLQPHVPEYFNYLIVNIIKSTADFLVIHIS